MGRNEKVLRSQTLKVSSFKGLICRMIHVSETHLLFFKRKLVTYAHFILYIVLLTTKDPMCFHQ